MLRVEVGGRAEDVVDALVDALAIPLVDPFQAEWVSVPTLGFRSWLRFRLAERLGAKRSGDGVLANVDMPFPSEMRWRVLAALARRRGDPEVLDPWRPERLVWSLMAVMSDERADIDDRLRRSSLPTGVTLASRAGPVADLFDRYGVHRPEMMRAWADGRDVGSDGVTELPPDVRWQPRLYRAARSHVAEHHGGIEPPAERLAEALDQVRSGELSLTDTNGGQDLPARLFLVGQSTIAAELGPVLDAVATQVDVHVLLLSPSPTASRRLADQIAGDSPTFGTSSSWAFPRRFEAAQIRTEHPLLVGWARRPLESALLLGAGGIVPEVIASAEEAPSNALLRRLQSDLSSDRKPNLDPDGPAVDRSVQVHAAPGPTRQVEVLRDVILGLLRDTPGLTESDIAILCPQLEQFGPVLTAVLGPSAQREEQPTDGVVPALRYTVIDRDARSSNPVLSAMAALIDLVPGRFDAASVRDLLYAPAVRERFDLTSEDLSLLGDVIDDTGIRWGLDGDHRQPWGIDPSHEANSWSAGLHQMLMGVALGDDLRDVVVPGSDGAIPPAAGHALAVGAIAPMALDDGSIASSGRLAAALRTLAHVHDLFRRPVRTGGEASGPAPRAIHEWIEVLHRAADFLVAPERFEEWQRSQFDEALADLARASTDVDGLPASTPLTLGDVRRLLTPALEGARMRADLGYGSIVVARPSLLANVPFRVVCLLGLDDGALPVGAPSGDDVTVSEPFVGDRDARAEARADVLSALMSAREHLVIACTSKDIRSNAVVPRSVLLDELLETIADTVPAGSSAKVIEEHPRQAFDPRNFRLDAYESSGGHPFSFDPAALAGAHAAFDRTPTGNSSGVDLLLEAPLGPVGDGTEPIELEEVRRFYAHPVKSFFQRRLSVVVPSAGEAGDSELPTQITPLEESGIGADLIEIGLRLDRPEDVRIDGAGIAHPMVEAVITSLRARGALPPASVALPRLEEITEEAAALLEVAERYGARRPASESFQVSVPLPGGRRLRGMVNECLDGPDPGPVVLRYARDKPRYRLAVAVDLLVLTASRPEVAWRGVYVARGEKGKPPVVVVQRVVGADAVEREATARSALDTLVSQYRDGMRYPLPLFDKTSFGVRSGAKAAKSAWGELTSVGFSFSKECLDVHHQLAFGALRYDELEAMDAGGYSLRGEAERLWGTLEAALVAESADSTEVVS